MTDEELKAAIEKEFTLWDAARWVAIFDFARKVRDAERRELAQLKAAARELIAKLPRCDAEVIDDEPTPSPTGSGWKHYGNHQCGKPATHYEVGAWGGECPCPTTDARCDEHHGVVDVAPWAEPLRVLSRMVE